MLRWRQDLAFEDAPNRNDSGAGARVRRVILEQPVSLATLARYGLRVMPSWSWSSWRSNLLG